MIAQIPTKIDVDPKAVPPVTITYSGPPKFVAIEGTTLSYAENTTEKVIMVNVIPIMPAFQDYGILLPLRRDPGHWQHRFPRLFIPFLPVRRFTM